MDIRAEKVFTRFATGATANAVRATSSALARSPVVLGNAPADTPPPPPAGRTAFFVSPTGNDSNPGTRALPWLTMAKAAASAYVAGDQILFQRNGTYYGTGFAENPGANGSNRLLFGAYGAGAQPLLTNRKNLNIASGWALFSSNVWRINLTSAATHTGWTSGPSAGNSNTGHITVNGTVFGNKRQSTAAMTSNWDFYDDGTFLYVRATANPTTLAANIIAAPDGRMIQANSNTEINNLAFSDIGGHAVSTGGSNSANVRVLNNTVTNIGGSFLIGYADNTVRYGNGIECFGPASNWLVDGNNVSQCYDAALTAQGGTSFSNIVFSNNIASDSPYLWEYFQDAGNTASGMVVNNNTFNNGGSGWSAAWKAGIGEPHAVFVTWTNPSSSTAIEVRNNVINGATQYVYGGASAPSPWINYHNNTIRLASGTQMRSGQSYTINNAAAYASAFSTESGSTFTVL